jgi:hypothetical protein
MKTYLKYVSVLVCAILFASPAFGVKTYYGGYASNTALGDATASGGAYYDMSATPTWYYAEYGMDASANAFGTFIPAGSLAQSSTTHSESNGPNTVTVGEPGDQGTYQVSVEYGGTVTAEATKTDPALSGSSAYAQVAAKITIENDDDDMGQDEMYGESVILASNYVPTHLIQYGATTSAYAKGIVGYNVQSLDNEQEIWGANSGTATTTTTVAKPTTSTQPNGQADGISDLRTYSFAGKYPDGDYYSYATAGLSSAAHAENVASSSSKSVVTNLESGAWDATTYSTLTKTKGTENCYATVAVTTTADANGFVKGDEATATTALVVESYKDYFAADGSLELESYTPFFMTYAQAQRAVYNDDRASAESYIIDGSYDTVAQRDAAASIKTEIKANPVNVASGAHAINPGNYYSTAYPEDNYAEYDDGYMDTEFDFMNEQDGPKFLLSGTSKDDAGSYIRFGSLDNEVSSGGSLVYGTSIDEIDYMAWIEGSSLVFNTYPTDRTWSIDLTAPASGIKSDDYERYFDASHPAYRHSDSEIYASAYA